MTHPSPAPRGAARRFVATGRVAIERLGVTLRAVLISLVAVIVAAGCGGDDGLVVFAAASLEGHLPIEGDEVTSFAGSDALVAQVLDGAPVDILITANAAVAQPVIDRLQPDVVALVRNQLAVVVPPGNPGGVEVLDDLARPALAIAVCATEVPCGSATAELPVNIAADTREPSVRSVLTKVELGEADVGVVYATDLERSAVEALDLLATPPTVTYQAMLLTDDTKAAEYFDWLTSAGQTELIAKGFAAP